MRPGCAISALLVLLLMTAGCTVRFGSDTDTGGHETPHTKAPVDDDGVEVWDLRTPPSASDVGLRDDKDYVGYEAYEVMGRSLKAFGLDTGPVDRWRQDIGNRPTGGPSSDLRIEGGGNTTIGYVNIGVGGVYDPFDGDDSVTIKYHVNLY